MTHHLSSSSFQRNILSITLRVLICFTFLRTGNSFSDLDLSLTTLNPTTTGWKITGTAVNNGLGNSVSAGDIDNDGYDDIIVGAYGVNGNQGAAYVIYGGPKSSMSNWDFSSGATLNPSTTGFTITGNAASDLLGYSVSTAGDINNDGYDDIIVGAFGKYSKRGVAYVIYGGPKASMSDWDFSSGATLNPSTTGFMMAGNGANDFFGSAVGTAGDINNDGYDDIIVGAFGENGNQGAVYVIYGGAKSSMSNWDFSSGSTLTPSTTGFMITGNAANDGFGVSLSTAGDINSDGYDEIIVGASAKSSAKGAAYVIYGGAKSTMSNIALSSTTLNPTSTGFMIKGNAPGDNLGLAVSTAGDINQDGYDDIIVGAGSKGNNRGAAYVIYGGAKSSMSNIDLSSTALNPIFTGIMITGDAASRFGYSVSTARDINSDGFDDIIVGAYTKNNEQGVAYVIYGGAKLSLTNIDLSSTSLDPLTTGFMITGNAVGDNFGVSVSSSRTGHLIVGAGQKNSVQGAAYVIYSEQTDQVCPQGYTLSNSRCVLSISSSQQTQGKATRAISSTANVVSSVVSVGSSVPSLAALISKLVQNTRYLDLSVTSDLSEIYQTWNTELISWGVPNGFINQDHFKTSPSMFARYDTGSPFLVNFWAALINIVMGLTSFIACIGLQRLFTKVKYEGRATSWVQKFKAGAFNFALVQAYACLDDILFYFVLDAKTNPFNNFFAWISMIFAIIILAFGCLQVFFNFWTVKKYQSIKNQGTEEIEAFNEKNKYWELFYSDFNDDDFWSQSFFAILIIRSTLSSFIITVLYDYPLMQTSFLVVLDGVILMFLYFLTPFTTLRATLTQYYYEIIALLVHLCTFILSLEGSFENPSDNVKIFFSNGIVYLNTALVTGTISFMFIDIYKTISHKIKAIKRKQAQSVPEENQETQSLTQSALPLQPSEVDDRKNLYMVNEEQNQNTTIENFSLGQGVNQNGNAATYELNIESSRVKSLPELEMHPRDKPINESAIANLIGGREQEISSISSIHEENHEDNV